MRLCLAAELGGRAAGDGDDADRRHVALEQGVGRLGRRMRQEHHVLGRDLGALEHAAEHLDHAGRDAARVGMGGQRRVAADDLVAVVVDQHRLGEGAADVDADAVRFTLFHRGLWPEMLLAGAAIEDLDLPADDGGMRGERLGRAVGRRPRLVLEVMEGVDAAHQGGAVARADRLLHMGRDVADGEADAPVVRLVGLRAVRQQHVVQRRLARA